MPIHEDFGFDLKALKTSHWPRFGVDGCIAHVKGRGDFVTTYALELPPGGRAAPQQHLFEELVLVLDRLHSLVNTAKLGFDTDHTELCGWQQW